MSDDDKIIDFAPYGWAVREMWCVNCRVNWVAVIPAHVRCKECPNCGDDPDIVRFPNPTTSPSP